VWRRRGWLVSPALVLVLPCLAADPDDVLQRASARLQAALGNLPKYACIETVERQFFEPISESGGPAPSCTHDRSADGRSGAGIPEATDRLRLEVTLSEGREIYSWPGATRFDPRDVGDIIRRGPIGTGSFGTHLLAVLNNPGVQFHFTGQETKDGRTLFEYRFVIAREVSRYRVRVGASWLPVAYEGSLWLDADSLELKRLNFRARQVPSDTSICRLDADLDYRNPSVAGTDVLLPTESQLRMQLESGRRMKNITTFSACRVYQAESALLFDENPASQDNPNTRIVRVPTALPLGLPVVLALTVPIDTATAAAGDQVAAKVVEAVRQPGTDIPLIPSGAIALGRLTRVEHHLLPSPYFLIAISFNRLDWQGAFAPFAAHAEGSAGLARELGASVSGPGGGVGYWNEGTFLFSTGKDHYVVPVGYRSKWMTLAIRSR